MKLTRIAAAAALALSSAMLFAVEVDERELETVSQDAVVFENYTGPHTVVNTASEIADIGNGLGRSVSADVNSAGAAGNSARYQIIHAIDPSEKGKLDADIFIIGASSSIDHIRNVRRIIAAYLSTAYGYSSQDANTVATFVTVYNAVYRGNLGYFQSKYKKAVTDNLTQDKAGIALSWRDWPGKTQIVIPLSDVNGGLSTVDTSVISDKKVVESMQEDDDKGVDTRKEMVDIKEREADNAQERANAAQKKATEETAKLKEEQQKSQEANKEAEEAAKTAQENPDDEQAQQIAEEKQAAAEEQAQKTEEQAQKAEEAKEEAAAAQAQADTKRTEAQTERTSIAQDQQEVVREQTANENAEAVYGLRSIDDLGVMSALVKMNADTGTVIKESPVTVIRTRTVYEAQDGYVAIAGTNIGNGAIKLVLLDKDNMEITKESSETLSETSVLVEDSGNYYCIVQDGSKFVVGKFNASLENLLKSPVAVKPATPITITSRGVLVTSIANRPILLSLNDLTLIQDTSAYADAK